MLKQVCIVAVTLMLCITLGEVAWTIHTSRSHLNQTLTDLDRTVIIAGATAGDVERASRKWEEASESQIQATTKVLSSVSAVAAQTGVLLSRTDNSLNSLLTPQMLSALNQQNDALLSNQAALRDNLSALRSATDSLKLTLSDADKQIASPQIANSLSNIEASTLNLNAGIKNLTGVTADAKAAADYELAQLQKPEKVWMAILKFVLQYGADARGLFVGFH
jgi:chromosome segregation ATPase